MMELYPYQTVGKVFLRDRRVACLWDEPGLGKTVQAITAWREIPGVENVLIVCPASVIPVWHSEIEKADGCHSVDGHQIKSGALSYDMAAKHHDDLSAMGFDLIVLDEAHYIKNRNAKRTKAILATGKIADSCERVWLLTGTPMPNNPSELWPMLHALFPDAIAGKNGKPMSYWQFVSRYCTTRNNGFGQVITGGKNLKHLREHLRERCLRRKGKDVLTDLPPVRHHMLPVTGQLSIVAETTEMVTAANLIKVALSSDDPMGELKKLAGHVATLRRLLGIAKVDGVVQWLKDNFDSHGPMVVFAHHKDVIDMLHRQLPNSVTLTGSSTPEAREWAVKDFQDGKADYFIGNIVAAGVGITLTKARVCVIVEPSWVPAENQQAAKRIHRIGQEHSCLVYYAATAGSLDEDIIKAVRRKTTTIKELGL